MSKKNNQQNRQKSHQFALKREREETERLRKKLEKKREKQTPAAAAAVPGPAAGSSKRAPALKTTAMKRKAPRIKKNAVIRGIKIRDAASKEKVRSILADEAQQAMTDGAPKKKAGKQTAKGHSKSVKKPSLGVKKPSLAIKKKVVLAGKPAKKEPMALALLVLSPPACAREEIFGPARVVDGDTIVVGSTRVRLFGIDAPENKQSCALSEGRGDYECGAAAKASLDRRIAGAPVRCEAKSKDMYGRTVAICSVEGPARGPAVDLNAWMVTEGQAVAYRRYSQKYTVLEDAARTARKGIWGGDFEEPEAWRKGHPRGRPKPGAPPAVAPALAAAVALPAQKHPAGCAFKGNITAKGERVYHAPGGRSYDVTKVNPSAGERWFCSATDAESAGWRAPKY